MDALSPRQHEVAALARKGLCNKEIAAQLGISYSCVKQHLGKVYAKLGVQDRIQLILRSTQERQG